MSEPVLRTEDLTKRFGGYAAVDGVSLSVGRGELRGLIGPNGAGKTTFFDLVSGVLAPASGRVYLRGEDVTATPAHRRVRRGMARALQIAGGFPSLSVRENVLGAVNGRRRFLSPFGRYRADGEAVARAEAVLDRVGLGDVAGEPVENLSHADRKLLEVGLALGSDPDLLLLDEPTAGLSAGETREMASLVAELGREMAVLLVEHDMDVVMEAADSLTVLHRGEVLAEGTPTEVRADDRVRDVYLGREP